MKQNQPKGKQSRRQRLLAWRDLHHDAWCSIRQHSRERGGYLHFVLVAEIVRIALLTLMLALPELLPQSISERLSLLMAEDLTTAERINLIITFAAVIISYLALVWAVSFAFSSLSAWLLVNCYALHQRTLLALYPNNCGFILALGISLGVYIMRTRFSVPLTSFLLLVVLFMALLINSAIFLAKWQHVLLALASRDGSLTTLLARWLANRSRDASPGCHPSTHQARPRD